MHWDDIVYPNLYIVLVGPSGCRKGTAMKPGRLLLNKVGIRLAPKAASREALIQCLIESYEQVTDPEDNKILAHCSMNIYSGEFIVFLGDNNLPLIMALTDWHDCDDRWPYQTISRGEESITGVWVNILGAITPELLQRALTKEVTGGGLTGRIIFVYADRKGSSVPLPFDWQGEEGEDLFGKLKADLESIKSITGRFKPTEAFIDLWVSWYTMNDSNPPFKDHRLEPYIARKAPHLLKLSMIMSASRSNSRIVEAQDLERAMQILEITEKLMPRVFGGIGDSLRAATMDRLRRCIEGDKELMFSTLMDMFILDVDSKKELLEMLVKLEISKFCKLEEIRDENGRLKDIKVRLA